MSAGGRDTRPFPTSVDRTDSCPCVMFVDWTLQSRVYYEDICSNLLRFIHSLSQHLSSLIRWFLNKSTRQRTKTTTPMVHRHQYSWSSKFKHYSKNRVLAGWLTACVFAGGKIKTGPWPRNQQAAASPKTGRRTRKWTVVNWRLLSLCCRRIYKKTAS